MQQLETDDPAFAVFHQDDLFRRLLANMLFGGLIQPDGQRMSDRIVNHLDLVQTASPILILSHGYGGILNVPSQDS